MPPSEMPPPPQPQGDSLGTPHGDSPVPSPMESADGVDSGAHVFEEEDSEGHRGINLGLPAVRAPPSPALK